MKKRRYSEEFYSEIDALIRLQEDRAKNRFQDIQIAISGGKAENHQYSSESQKSPEANVYLYNPNPSSWKNTLKNPLFRYVLAFCVVFVVVISLSVFFFAKVESSREKKQVKQISIKHKKFENKKTDEANVQSARARIKKTAANPTKEWPEPEVELLQGRDFSPENKVPEAFRFSSDLPPDVSEEIRKDPPPGIGKSAAKKEKKEMTPENINTRETPLDEIDIPESLPNRNN